MPTKHLLVALSLLVTTALAQTESTPSPASSDTAYELEGRVDAKKLLPADVMKGGLHSVAEQAENDGLLNTYFFYSGDQAFAVTTGRALRTRIRELYAIDKLRATSKTEEFGKAMATAGKQKLESVKGVVEDPVGTIKRVPQGASRFFGRIGDSIKSAGSDSEGNKVQGITGVEKAKVKLAAKLGVSPYSTNQELQEQLTNTARAMAGGGFVLNMATGVVGGPVGSAITVLNVNQTLQDALINSTPDELHAMNRKKLTALGAAKEDANEFLMHPWYSPWHETITTDALATIGVDPTSFLQAANRALTEQDANYFQSLAQVLARYHKTKAPLSSIRVEEGRVCAMDTNGILVVPLSCDYAIWNEANASRVELFGQLPQSKTEIKGLALWVDGKVSERATAELKNRKIELATGVLDGP
ncbi:MAG: hypothetical protein WAO00_07020 [Chthoniobacterales bacterium]